MNSFGFVRCAVAVPQLTVADCDFNARKILELIEYAENQQVELLVFPELSITAYTCADLFFQQKLREDAEQSLLLLLEKTKKFSLIFIVGMPIYYQNALYNVAAICQSGNILGFVPKTHLPNYQEFAEKRWFASGINLSGFYNIANTNSVVINRHVIFESTKFSFGIEFCEDLWTHKPSSAQLSMNGADIICNLSASNELVGKHLYRRFFVEQQSVRCSAGYIYASAGMGESTTDFVFSGAGFIVESGITLAETERFSLDSQIIISEIDVERLRTERIKNSNFNSLISKENYQKIYFENKKLEVNNLYRKISPYPFIPSKEDINAFCDEIFSIQTAGLCKRWQHTNCQTLIVGVSGGLDSTLALLVAVNAADKLGYDRKRVVGITMPGFGTTNRTYLNAISLMTALGITQLKISIKASVLRHFKDIGQNPENHDVTYENAQARERTQILMDIANQKNGLVVGTGDLSELALGWTTYNGDHMSMYAVNCSVPKTLVRYLIEWAAMQADKNSAKILKDILFTPVSPELLPTDNKNKISQVTEDVIGPYELHDFFLYYFVRHGFTPNKILFLAKIAFNDIYSEDIIKKWLKIFLKRFFQNQFKRSCLPDGPKIGSISLSPRGNWRMPSDAVSFRFDN
ncbi:MAG: NAD(+) synthase [Paludibacter sp.]|nr:NAD(+) synthase [Paludibacter sp.]